MSSQAQKFYGANSTNEKLEQKIKRKSATEDLQANQTKTSEQQLNTVHASVEQPTKEKYLKDEVARLTAYICELEDKVSMKDDTIEQMKTERVNILRNMSRLESKVCAIKITKKCETMEDSILKAINAVINKHYYRFGQR